jgi:hypothetical protein
MALRFTTSDTNRPCCTAFRGDLLRAGWAASGADLPQFVKDELDAFLESGIPAHGFERLGDELVVNRLQMERAQDS